MIAAVTLIIGVYLNLAQGFNGIEPIAPGNLYEDYFLKSDPNCQPINITTRKQWLKCMETSQYHQDYACRYNNWVRPLCYCCGKIFHYIEHGMVCTKFCKKASTEKPRYGQKKLIELPFNWGGLPEEITLDDGTELDVTFEIAEVEVNNTDDSFWDWPKKRPTTTAKPSSASGQLKFKKSSERQTKAPVITTAPRATTFKTKHSSKREEVEMTANNPPEKKGKKPQPISKEPIVTEKNDSVNVKSSVEMRVNENANPQVTSKTLKPNSYATTFKAHTSKFFEKERETIESTRRTTTFKTTTTKVIPLTSTIKAYIGRVDEVERPNWTIQSQPKNNKTELLTSLTTKRETTIKNSNEIGHNGLTSAAPTQLSRQKKNVNKIVFPLN